MYCKVAVQLNTSVDTTGILQKDLKTINYIQKYLWTFIKDVW